MKIKIVYIGKFRKLWDEEYIARGFESIGCEVFRMEETTRYRDIIPQIMNIKPDFVLFAKFNVANPHIIMSELKKNKIKTVCWVWDLYFGYQRQYLIHEAPMFKADIVITTDGGHQKEFKDNGINHFVVRQGIYTPECYRETADKEFDIVFVGSANVFNDRYKILDKINTEYNLEWFGKENTDEIRGKRLNELYAKTKIVVGDSVYSPFYWSNRIVETLGRGGFLIHQEVEGLKEEYPYLVTYKRGDYDDLKKKIDFYLTHDTEREKIIKKNLKWVKDNYTIEHQCKKVLDICLK